jgi:hypothetical protein
MSTRSFTKAERREIRRLAGLAHERELRSAAADLHAKFKEWRDGKIDVFALNEHIHKYHDGISRELYKRYAMGEAHWSVASAIARGVLQETEVLPALVENLRNVIDLAREMSREDEKA